MYNTASGAGRVFEIRWATVKGFLVRTEVLQKHLRNLMKRNLVNRSDEAASARRRFKDLVGPSGLKSTLEKVGTEGIDC